MVNGRFHKRETFKEQAYFDSQVAYNEGMLRKFEAKIMDATTDPEHRWKLRYSLFRSSLEQLIMRYSRGESVSALRDSFPLIVRYLSAYNSEGKGNAVEFNILDGYVQAVWLVSLAFLLEIDEDLFAVLLRELNNEGSDAMFERLVALRVSGRPQALTLLYPKPYQPLLDAVNAEGKQQTQLIQKFLRGYFAGLKKAYWYNTHLGEDAGFFGYWCFELAAFVKALDIDDAAFAENIFYPVDLVRNRD
jgi:hypothetical protein